MGLIDKIRGEFIDIIEWTEPSQNQILAYRFPRHQNEIKMGARLTVREGQAAVFVNEGQIADVFTPGMYTLETKNLPILSTIKGWAYGFNSPFKAEVYFISTRQWTDLRWGTQNPIMLRDAEIGPVRVRAFGTYAMHVSDPAAFLKQLVATDPSFEAFEVTNQLRNVIVARFADTIGLNKVPLLELAGQYDQLSKTALERIAPDLAPLGLALTSFYIENISLPPEVEEALDKRSQMGVLGNLDQYIKFQTGHAITDAAQNPGGVAGVGAGLGAGMAMANQMTSALQPSTSQPPPLPNATVIFIVEEGKQSGPYDLPTLTAKAQSGSLQRSTLAWKQGMSAWVAAETIPELYAIFAAIPPALPPQ
jgi:membrane protease subunit (stomatin/prohibitin family)